MTKKINFLNVFRIIALLEALLLLVLIYSLGSKIDTQKEMIEQQKKKLEEARQEVIRLKLVEQDLYQIIEEDY